MASSTRPSLLSFGDAEIEDMATGVKSPLSSLWSDGKATAIAFLRRLG